MTEVTFNKLRFLFFLIEIVRFGSTGDVTYSMDIVDEIMSCPDFDNNVYQADKITVGLVSETDDEEGAFGLNGPIEINAEVNDQQDLTLAVSKETEVGQEHLFNARGNICSSMQDEDAPWYVILKAMNVSACPIATGSYMMKNVKMDVGSMDQFMTRDNCGAYQVIMKIETPTEVLSCHILQMEISEQNTE